MSENMCRILCSTGALIGKPNNRNYKLLEGLSSKLTCDGFEFMMYSSWYDWWEEIVKDLQQMELNIPVMHCEKHIGEAISRGGEHNFREAMELFAINIDMANKLNAQKIVIHLWDGETSDQHFENNSKAYEKLSEIAQKQNVDLLVENVVCNKENPMKHWCQLVEQYPDIHFVFDTKMAAFHNQLAMLYQEEYSWLWKEGHIKHYHVNDYGGGYMDWKNLRTLPIGKGHIDFEEFFRFINHIGYQDTFTVEATAFNKEGIIDTDMLNQCFSFIRKHV